MKLTLPMLRADLANHVLYGAGIFVAVGAGAAYLGLDTIARPAGAVAAVAAGALKEWLDYRANKRAHEAGQPDPHRVEGVDLAATAAGAALVWAGAAFTGV